ncbi:MAG TPA: ABC transporter substrate-binding protein [Iamia sp.]|nr:ABC transporter substrate-binding protein [Iamia sp.]
MTSPRHSAGASPAGPTPAPPAARPGVVRRFGPVAVLAVAILLVAVLATVKGRSDDEGTRSASPEEVGLGGEGGEDPTDNPDLPITLDEATASGEAGDIEWGDTCDLVTGRVRLPSIYAPPCVPVFEGDNGGETTPGVTADTIKVVAYQPAPGGDITAALTGLLDPEDVQQETRAAFVEMLSGVFETYGRTVELEVLVGSGGADDDAAAVADAIKVAEEIKPFAVIGGPPLTTAFADQLAERGILCIGCGLGVPDSRYQANAPYMWGTQPTPEQFLVNFGDYLVKRLFRRPAEFAGEALRDRERVFGVVNFEQDPPVFGDVAREILARGQQRGYEPAVRETYILDIPRLPERAAAIVAKLKAAGVTTVVFLGDPLMPIYLTQAATAEDYYPEWVIAGTVLTDTTALGRLYDGTQWTHAFGVSNQAGRKPIEQQEQWRLHEWWFGREPEAKLTSAVIWGNVQLLMLGIHMAGPNLTPETFQGGLFSYPPSGGGPTTPQISFGNHGLFEAPDYITVDDVAEIWWDAEAIGPDEQNRTEEPGMWRYANGGIRIPPGRMPSGPPPARDPATAPTLFETIPPQDQFPEYPPPPNSPAAG